MAAVPRANTAAACRDLVAVHLWLGNAYVLRALTTEAPRDVRSVLAHFAAAVARGRSARDAKQLQGALEPILAVAAALGLPPCGERRPLPVKMHTAAVEVARKQQAQAPRLAVVALPPPPPGRRAGRAPRRRGGGVTRAPLTASRYVPTAVPARTVSRVSARTVSRVLAAAGTGLPPLKVGRGEVAAARPLSTPPPPPPAPPWDSPRGLVVRHSSAGG